LHNLTGGNEDLPVVDGVRGFADLACEHRMKHCDIVLRKVQHAKAATRQSIQEYNILGDTRKSKEFDKIRRYDSRWHMILDFFEDADLSERGLYKIEYLLSRLPEIIKKYYDILVSGDYVLRSLVMELASDKYKAVRKAIRKLKAAQKEFGAKAASVNYKPENPPKYILKRISNRSSIISSRT